MANCHWLLPEAIEDVLPVPALRIESLRQRLLSGFAAHGYDYVMPPLLEYTESLLVGGAHDLDLRTFKLVDQLSGRTMGLRADITPQVARIDAHLLNRKGVTRLCYCGSVLHTLPAGFNSTREPLQIGAELYGHAGLEADIEVIRLLAKALSVCSLDNFRLDLGHVAVFRALAAEAELTGEAEDEVLSALRGKDVSTLRELLAGLKEPLREAILILAHLHGGVDVLLRARQVLPKLPAVTTALDDLQRLADALGDLPLGFDLADLRGYRYHGGLVFAAYTAGSPGAVALGGRYDGLGRVYGRERPATGFSMDLRELARISAAGETGSSGAILLPWPADAVLQAEAERLRASGERVVLGLPGHEGSWREAGCDRVLVRHGEKWKIESLKEV